MLARGVAEGDLVASESGLDGIARYYTTVVQGLSIQARDGGEPRRPGGGHHVRHGRVGGARSVLGGLSVPAGPGGGHRRRSQVIARPVDARRRAGIVRA